MALIDPENIIIRYLTSEATASDLDFLSEWIKNPDNEKVFENYVEVHYKITTTMNDPDIERLKKQLLERMEKDTNPFYRKRFKSILKYAAIIAFAFGLGYLYQKEYIESPTGINKVAIEPGTDKATLRLEDGSKVVLEKGQAYETQNANSNGEQIIYASDKSKGTEIVYNYLTIPRGGQFQITLSDRTQVWLNSESQIKYPVTFVSGQTRSIELIYGEAYFDVSPSTEHNGAKFKVYNKSQEIEVLGTEFNIKAYKDEANIYTTLVEGKVSVGSATTDHILKPGEQAKLSLNDNTMAVSEVNVYNETSWKDGIFSFRRKPLIEIMKVLSRWYDIEFVFENPQLEKAGFNGVLDKNQHIEDILESIKGFGVIKNYEINDKTIILK